VKLELEAKQQRNESGRAVDGRGRVVGIVTPPIREGYWLFRVKVSETQAVVGFPKFNTIGIGFEVEGDDWNTNLPYRQDAERIYQHIRKNKGSPRIRKADCIAAIKLIQEAASLYLAAQQGGAA
jgi:hypothetical protein